jgi:4-diphosphocytidyl-2-C-methyl-D-erythritol kinase
VQAVHRERALAKLTRSLRVTGRRDDGYHLLESEMVCLDFGDDLDIEPLAPGDPPSALEVVDEVNWVGVGTWDWGSTGRPAPGAEGPSVPLGPDNLVLKALALTGRAAQVRLVKRVPPGAGLGGGSADAAAVLRWAGSRDPQLAARLGGDVPFCVRGGRALVTGIGEHVVPLETDRATYLLCTPSFGVSTALVYAAYDELARSDDPAPARARPQNDLESAALLVEPRLAGVRDLLREVTGRRPTLAGSGSTWYVGCRPHEGLVLAAELVAAVGAARGGASINLARTTDAF